MSMDNPIWISHHPLIKHHLTILRDANTGPALFRQAAQALSYLLAYEVMRDLSCDLKGVETPLARTVGHFIDRPVLLVPVLRAALGMVPPFLDLYPDAQVGHIGLSRDEVTLLPTEYLTKLPKDLKHHQVIIQDPMLATGGSLCRVLEKICDRGASHIRVVCVVAAPEGTGKVMEAYPQVQIFAAAVDVHLNERGYIVPGLGDFGDRLMGWVD